MRIVFLLSLIPAVLFAKTYEEQGLFSGHISKLSENASLVRVRSTFVNRKYLNPKDKVQFWSDENSENSCIAYVVAKGKDHILFRVPQYSLCVKNVGLSVGSYLRFFSNDLNENISTGEELIRILLKKRVALKARLNRFEKQYSTYPNKLEAINQRYEILKQQLELERSEKLAAVEKDRSKSYLSLMNTQSRLNEVDYKIEKYRVESANLVQDRWSLDERLYLKK